MPDPRPQPVNQKIRFWVARVALLLCLPIIFFTESAWEANEVLHTALEMIGALTIVAAVLGRFWAILYIGGRKNDEVVQIGPYSMCRHPLYFSSTLGVVGFGLMLGSFTLAAALGIVTFVILSQTAKREERFLRVEFAPTYDEYARRVPMIWPRWSQFHSPTEVTFNTHTLRTNLADAMGFLALIPVAEVIESLHEAGAIWGVTLY
ncbi:MAG: isoprenylcysteine carboxylmethyltransferase family protein [Pararhodobacter sp.]|nr:isoprenylcysteine carboxylmethyltransferase family protein [Pararhodobacter sp.]